MTSASATHDMLPEANHDEVAEQLFIRDLKGYIASAVEPHQAKLAASKDPGDRHNERIGTVYNALWEEESFRSYASLRRASQELLWQGVSQSVDRQADALNQKASASADLGSLHLDPEFEAPDYVVCRDVHIMPGGYMADRGGVEQGALMDRGGAVYMLGRNGGLLNDVRGRTLASHLLHRWPDLAPEKILELGCGIGASIVPVAKAFPAAEVSGVDIGGSMLRYAKARAAALDTAINFYQGSAESTPFENESFDVVFSCVLMHETSPEAMDNIMSECMRLLKPGGIVAHLEVPHRYEEMDLWARVRGEIEYDFNNEPNWKYAISQDYQAMLAAEGFTDVVTGYQDAERGDPRPGNDGFGGTSKGLFASWFVASGKKPT